MNENIQNSGNQVYTPYKAIARVNAEGLCLKKVNPQELYARVRTNKVPSKVNEVGTLTVRWEDVLTFIDGLNTRIAAKAKASEAK